jgi:hypothetical protein
LTGHYSARGAAVGGRTIKTGQSRWFVGYKKHTLRLWLSHYTERVLLVPLVSWLAPGNRGDALFLPPSVRYCARHLDWVPELVVGDMGYINQAAQRELRQHWGVGVLTRLRPDMNLIAPFEAGPVAVCAQGQRLEWLGYEARDHLHWFGVRDPEALCVCCWEASQCAHHFSYPPEAHEILFGTVPLASRVAQRLLQQVRPWIEPAQSYEKNQLGLGTMFLNSLRLTWTLGLLADTVVLLRAHALLSRRPVPSLLAELLPQQLPLDLEEEK